MELLFKVTLLSFILISNFDAKEIYNQSDIKRMIGRTIILGFDGDSLNENASLQNDIKRYSIGGIILFDKYYKSKKKKNIKNKEQLKTLIYDIQKASNYKMFISIDQEGGWVSRLNPKNGFNKIPTAKLISKKDIKFAKKTYRNLAQELSDVGINLNFAPVVDLAINKKNRVIVYQGRSFGKSSKKVIKYSKIFINEMNKKNIISVLKHFPGHGSSLKDSHDGFVDITNTWNKKELVPYKELINSSHAKMIMTAHVFNKNLDKKYPATLSSSINTSILREKMNYKNLIISDDLQMGAITENYTLKQTVTLAINSGVNILLFGNHINNKSMKLEKIINTIYKQILDKKIKLSSIIKSNELIESTLN